MRLRERECVCCITGRAVSLYFRGIVQMAHFPPESHRHGSKELIRAVIRHMLNCLAYIVLGLMIPG